MKSFAFPLTQEKWYIISKKVRIQYAEFLIREGNKELAIQILKKLLVRNTTFNPARKILSKIK